jgi:hypothetical protein
MQKTEVPLNTEAQVMDYLRAALSIVEDCDVPEDLRVAACAAVYNSVAGKQVFFEQVQPLPDLARLGARH